MDAAQREEALGKWFAARFGVVAPQLRALAGDASFRRYFRVVNSEAALILCDSPPTTEKNREFKAIGEALAAWGLRVPTILAADLEHGFFALEDLGDRTLLPALDDASVDAWYDKALDMLGVLAQADSAELALPPYSGARLREELRLFPVWFCEALLGLAPTPEARRLFDDLESCLVERALGQAQVVVHRDFHARNLMLVEQGRLAMIDFQDAVIGPVTYDPVSLLRDCYRAWPAQRVRAWAGAHYDRLGSCGLALGTRDEFMIDFDWMGLQRHIKVLGIFARLYLRDGKAVYLPDLPRVIAYVRQVLASYPDVPALAEFAAWFEHSVMPQVQRQAWFVETLD